MVSLTFDLSFASQPGVFAIPFLRGEERVWEREERSLHPINIDGASAKIKIPK